MSNLSRAQRRGARLNLTGVVRSLLGGGHVRPAGSAASSGHGHKAAVAPFKKPREWLFQTKPLFKRVREPLVDVFMEAQEVLIVIDLGGFGFGDVSLTMTPEKYFIHARSEGQEFREEIPLPPEVDVKKCVENFRNGVLEIVLPRKRKGKAS